MEKRKGSSFLAVYAIVALAVILLSIQYFAKPAPSIDNGIKKFASYSELESFIRKNSEGYYWGPGDIMAVRAAAPMAAAESAGIAAQTYSRTNVQVEGVDEADIVKTDGKYIYAVTGGNGKVAIVDAYPAETATNISELDFDGKVNGLFVSKNRLVVFWQENLRIPLPAVNVGVAEEVPQATGVSEKKIVAGPARGIPRLEDLYRYSQKTHIDVYDISDRKAPVLASNISVDGSYFGSRMISNQVYVIATQPAYYVKGEPIPLPAIRSSPAVKTQPTDFPDVYYFDVPDRYYAFTSIVSVNVNDGAISSKILLAGATQNLYVSANNIYISYSKYSGNMQESDIFIDRVVLPIVPGTVKSEIKRIREDSNLTRYEKWGEIQKALDSYSKTLSELERDGLELAARQKMAELEREFAKEREKTVIQKLSISDGKVEYKTNGEVPGTVLNQFSMDEHNGYFRIATTTSQSGGMLVSTAKATATMMVLAETAAETKPQPVPALQERQQFTGPMNHVYILDENLKTVGKLEDLAHGERIYSVRFMGDKGYMVTFRQVDPLFVIDLSKPAEPKVLGFLKIPGVSDYLHPYDETHLIGVGRDATEEGRITGMKLSLFDVTNVSSPKEISKYTIGQRGTDSEALRDHKAFLFDRQKSLLVIPVSESGRSVLTDNWSYWQGAYVFALDLTNGFALKGKISHFNMTGYEWDATIRRSLYIDDVLYTISSQKLKANRLSDLSEIKELALPTAWFEKREGRA